MTLFRVPLQNSLTGFRWFARSHVMPEMALKNVWIADASLFPNVTSGNINAPVMMLASKAVDSICNQLSK